MKKNNLYLHVILSILLIFSSVIFSTKLVINFKPLYYYDIVNLNLEKASGLNASTIKLNYDYLINYLNKNSVNNFALPTLSSTDHAKLHFYEVYNLVNKLFLSLYVFVPIIIVGLIITFCKKQFLYLKICGIVLTLLPFLFSPLIYINFNDFFTLFHKLIFHNNYWLFNPKTDPVILILPEAFFMHCLISIVVLSFFIGLMLLYIYIAINRKKKKYLFINNTKLW